MQVQDQVGSEVSCYDKNKYKDDNEKTTDILRRVIMKKMGNNVKENFDNNNVVLKGINEIQLKNQIDYLNMLDFDKWYQKANQISFHTLGLNVRELRNTDIINEIETISGS